MVGVAKSSPYRGSVDFIDKLNKQGYSLKGKKSSSLG